MRDDFEPPNREYMQKCAYKDEWIAGEQEELKSIAKHEVWMKKTPPPGTKIVPLKWIYRVKRNRMGEVVRWKCRLVAQGFFKCLVKTMTRHTALWPSLHPFVQY